MRTRRLAGTILAAGIGAAAATQARAEDTVIVQVSPRMCVEGCNARITVRIEPDHDNRALVVETDSPVYSRRSTIQLDGDEAPLVHTFRLRSLPSGTYVIRATLMRVGEETHATPMSLVVNGVALR
jgi:hypothetical protein